MTNKISIVSSLIGIGALTLGLTALPHESNAITFNSGALVTTPIPEPGLSSLFIDVPAQPAFGEKIGTFNKLTIFGLNHVNYGDVTIRLRVGTPTVFDELYLVVGTSPFGGTFNDATLDINNGTYNFVRSGGTTWNTAAANLNPGDFAPSQPLSLLDGTDLARRFTLEVFDFTNNNSGVSQGSFTGFEIDVTAVPFEFEASAGVAILGGLWLLRRKFLSKKRSEELG